MKIGLQLCVVENALKEDLLGTIKKIKDMGITGVEFAGFFDHDPKELKKILDDFGLECISATFDCPTEENIDYICETLDILGTKNCVSGLWFMNTEENFIKCFNQFKKGAELLSARGYNMIMHNHYMEHDFKYKGKTFYEYTLENIPNFYNENDLGWTVFAGYEPKERIEKYNAQIPLLHAKDVKVVYDEEWGDNPFITRKYSYIPALLGEGDANIKGCVEVSDAKWVVIEFDRTVIELWDAIQRAYDFLKNECGCE